VAAKSEVGTVLGEARDARVIGRLLLAGADPQDLRNEGRRALLGFDADPDEDGLSDVTDAEFLRAQSRRFGRDNPERMDEPFWLAMVRSGLSAYAAKYWFGREKDYVPTWSAQRFGQSLTPLPDGRVVLVGGEHEDSYDTDFCIYNDVVVREPGGALRIFGYPEDVFSPTDFHTATLAGGAIYLVGSLGYPGRRRIGETQVLRLDADALRVEPVATRGAGPGWIHRHRAELVSPSEILVSGGQVVTTSDGVEVVEPNEGRFLLDLRSGVWRRAP
jgi:hypothetical protein